MANSVELDAAIPDSASSWCRGRGMCLHMPGRGEPCIHYTSSRAGHVKTRAAAGRFRQGLETLLGGALCAAKCGARRKEERTAVRHYRSWRTQQAVSLRCARDSSFIVSSFRPRLRSRRPRLCFRHSRVAERIAARAVEVAADRGWARFPARFARARRWRI